MSYTFMTRTQFAKAMFLAQKHGHAWACEERVAEVFEKEDLLPSVELIDAIMTSKHEAIENENLRQMQGMGIQQPTMQDGLVVHTTGTGRLRWYVYRDGQVEIIVSRPNVECLISARVYPDGRVVVQYSDATLIFARHVEAAKYAAGCVADSADVEVAFQELDAIAQPDPQPEAEATQPLQEAVTPILPPLMSPIAPSWKREME